jgi:hypothetical protein
MGSVPASKYPMYTFSSFLPTSGSLIYHTVLLQLSTYKQNNSAEGRTSTVREITSWSHVMTCTRTTRFVALPNCRLLYLLIARDSRDWLASTLVTCCPSPFYIFSTRVPCLGFDICRATRLVRYSLIIYNGTNLPRICALVSNCPN